MDSGIQRFRGAPVEIDHVLSFLKIPGRPSHMDGSGQNLCITGHLFIGLVYYRWGLYCNILSVIKSRLNKVYLESMEVIQDIYYVTHLTMVVFWSWSKPDYESTSSSFSAWTTLI